MSGLIVSPGPDTSRASLTGVEIKSEEYLGVRRFLAQQLKGTVDADHALAVADLIYYQTRRIDWAAIAAFHDIGKNTAEAQKRRQRYGEGQAWTHKQKSIYRHLHASLGPRELQNHELREFREFRRSMETVCEYHHHSAVLIPSGPDKELTQRVQIADFYETLMVNQRTGSGQPKFSREEAAGFMVSMSTIGALDFTKVHEFISALGIQLEKIHV